MMCIHFYNNLIKHYDQVQNLHTVSANLASVVAESCFSTHTYLDLKNIPTTTKPKGCY